MAGSESKLEKIQKQIEYYLSEENLREDAFFHRAIASSDEGFIPVNLIMKCNRIIKLGATLDEVQASIESSPLLELSPGKESLRRKSHKQLPPLASTKVRVTLDSEDVPAGVNVFKGQVYSFTTNGKLGSAPELRRALGKSLGFGVPFVRVGKQAGEFICEADQKVEPGPKRAGKWRVVVSAMEGEEARKWLEQHRLPVEKAVEGNCSKRRNGSQGSYEILGRKFTSLNNLRDHLKLIINRTPDGAQLSAEDSAFVKEVLKVHEDPAKAATEGEITVDKHPDFPNTRCFFVLSKDGTRQDFSFHKCLGRLTPSKPTV